MEAGDYVRTTFWTGSGDSCGVSVERFESWLLFLDEDDRSVSLCGPSQPGSGATKQIETLRRLTTLD